MNVEHVHFITGGTVTTINFLLDWLWWIRRREWMWKGEKDDILRQSAVTGSVACLSLWRCLHIVK
jgi:hypothetical protein